LNLVKQRQGKLLRYEWIEDLLGVRKLEPVYEKRPFQEMTIASTLNTTVTCRVCMGKGKVLNKPQRGITKESLCGKCNGSGKMISV